MPKQTPQQDDPFLDEDLDDLNDDDVLDLSEVPDAGAFELWPSGIYNAIVDNVEFGRSQRSNNPMLTWHLKATNGEGKERTFWFFTPLIAKSLPRVKRTISRIAPDFDLSSFKPSQAGEYFSGKRCQIRLKIQSYEGERRNSVSDIMPSKAGADDFLD